MKKKVLVIGLGLSGRSSCKYLLSKGCEVVGVDGNLDRIFDLEEIKELEHLGAYIFSDKEPIDVTSFDEIVVSPGIPTTHKMLEKARSSQVPVIGEAELAFRSLGNRRALAITGTNGKTTVTLMVEHILNRSGYKARALGNVGAALTDNMHRLDPGEIVVAELSSYQLETLTSKVFHSAVILNITPDHLERYGNMDAYAEAKFKIQSCLKEGASFYIFSPIAKSYGHLLSEHFLTFGDDISSNLWTDGIAVKEWDKTEFFMPASIGSLPRHDHMNILAAWALCRSIGVSSADFIEGVMSFKKPAHRLEFIREIDGVQYFDDSKGTNIDAVIQAVSSMNRPVILLAGGVDKGASYSIWTQYFKDKVKELFVFGQSAEKIRKELGVFFKVTSVGSLSEAVALASASASFGDVVLLSPGCSSFDMFRDYAHRGEEFQKCVNLLEPRSGKNEP